MCEPLSVGVHAVSRANVTIGQTVLVTGSGLPSDVLIAAYSYQAQLD